MIWNPQPGDVCVPSDRSRGVAATVIESTDDIVVFEYNNGNDKQRHQQRVRLSTFISRYELLYRPEQVNA